MSPRPRGNGDSPGFLANGDSHDAGGGAGLRLDCFATEWRAARSERPRAAVVPLRGPFLNVLRRVVNDERTPRISVRKFSKRARDRGSGAIETQTGTPRA